VTRAATAVVWRTDDPPGLEWAEIAIGGGGLVATGTAIREEPLPYRLDATVEAPGGFVTSRLQAVARGEGWLRTLDLRRGPDGAWSLDASAEGDAPLPPPGGDAEPLAGALDCDLGLSPSTNTMPILRHGLLAGGEPVDLLMAWVSVPDLAVSPSRQRYTVLQARDGGRVVRFETPEDGFTADLVVGADGIVSDYPGLARRVVTG
jgi:hypothetical protein